MLRLLNCEDHPALIDDPADPKPLRRGSPMPLVSLLQQNLHASTPDLEVRVFYEQDRHGLRISLGENPKANTALAKALNALYPEIYTHVLERYFTEAQQVEITNPVLLRTLPRFGLNLPQMDELLKKAVSSNTKFEEASPIKVESPRALANKTDPLKLTADYLQEKLSLTNKDKSSTMNSTSIQYTEDRLQIVDVSPRAKEVLSRVAMRLRQIYPESSKAITCKAYNPQVPEAWVLTVNTPAIVADMCRVGMHKITPAGPSRSR